MQKENNQGWEVWQDPNPPNNNIESPSNPSPVWINDNNNQLDIDSSTNQNPSEPLFEWNEPENNDIPTNSDISDSTNDTLLKGIGRVLIPEIFKDCYSVTTNNEKTLSEIENINLSETESDGLYDFNPEENSSLGLLIKNIFNIGKQFNLRMSNCYIYDNTNEQFLNKILQNNVNTPFSFIYFFNNTNSLNSFPLDFSELNGPTFDFINPTPNNLYVFPGWLPVKSPKLSENRFRSIVGTFNLN